MIGWTERTAVFGHDAVRDVTVETTWLPALAGLGAAALAEAHARQLAAAGLSVEEPSVQGDAGLERVLRLPGQVGLAHYAQREDRLVRSVATAAEGTSTDDLRAALRLAAERDTAVTLSSLEARYVEELLGVPAVGFLRAPWWQDLDSGVRDLIGRELAHGLAGRGLLDQHDGSGWSLTPVLRRAVQPVLDADLVVVARRIGDDEAHTVALGRRQGAWSLAQENEPGRVAFAPLEPARVVGRLLDELLVPLDAPRMPDAVLDGIDAFPVLWQLTCVRAHDGGLESAELVWCLDSDGRLWTVPAPSSDEPVPYEPAGTADLQAALIGLLEPEGASA